MMLKTFVRFRSNVSEMVRVLNVAEKNDAAKSLADVMSRGGYRKVRYYIWGYWKQLLSGTYCNSDMSLTFKR